MSKLKIALKEAGECRYWLRLMGAVEILDEETTKSLITDVDELLRILTAIVKSKNQG